MTLEQFNLEFDILFNSISSNVAPSLSPLEKSILLTQAQELLVKEYYSGDITGNSFEKNEESKEYLNTLVTQTTATEKPTVLDVPFNYKSYEFPTDLLYIVNEVITVKNKCNESLSSVLRVKPSSNDEYIKSLDNPFTGPLGNIVLRRIENNTIFLYPPNTAEVKSYFITYIKRPEPIVLLGIEDAPAPYKQYIENGNNCSLPESCHQDVLLRAVQLARNVWVSQ